MTEPQSDRIISIKKVCDLTSLSRTTIWRGGRDGTFPKPHRLTVGRVGWSEADVLNWMRKRDLAPSEARRQMANRSLNDS